MWTDIEGDLEIIEQDGFDAAKCVDPNMVFKKKGGAEEEVQEGWKGRILPFELVQKKKLTYELDELKRKENRAAEIPGIYEEKLENLSEEDKEAAFVNEDKTAFVWQEVKKAIKDKGAEPEVIEILKEVQSLNDEEKELKKQIKAEREKLHIKTKETIESLSDEEVLELLEDKWIDPLICNITDLPIKAATDLVSEVKRLANKYRLTLSGIEAEIIQVEEELSSMLDDLTGNEFDVLGISELKKLLRG